jgi:hypothetical protein
MRLLDRVNSLCSILHGTVSRLCRILRPSEHRVKLTMGLTLSSLMSTGIAAGRCRELALSTRARVPLHQLRSPASTSARPASRFSLPNAVSSAPIPPPELPSTNRSLFTHPQCVADKRHGPLNADVLGPGYQPDPSSPRSGPLSSTHPIHSSDASEPPGDLRQSQAALDGGALLSPLACHRSLSLPLRIAHVMPHGRSARCV